MNKSLLTTIGVIIAVILSIFAISRPAQVREVVEKVSAGAVSSPDILSPYFSFGGARFWATKVDFATATTTVCAVQSPAATSTLVRDASTVNFTTSSTTASTVTVAKATTAFATTTLIRTESVGANAQATFTMASTTSVASAAAWALEQQNLTFAPNTWLVVSMAGGTGTFSPVGACSPVWKQANY